MMRYVIALFLLNTYSGSLGAPTNVTMTWTDALLSLSKNCGNLGKQIENTSVICSQNAVGKKLLECIMFYDINSQLCSAISNSKMIITDDISTTVNQAQDVENVCDSAKSWIFSKDIPLHQNLTTIFNSPELCQKFCGVEDILSTDSIYTCKYYFWAFEKLKSYSIPSTSMGAGKNTEASIMPTTELKQHESNNNVSVPVASRNTPPLQNDSKVTLDQSNSMMPSDFPNEVEAPSTAQGSKSKLNLEMQQPINTPQGIKPDQKSFDQDKLKSSDQEKPKSSDQEKPKSSDQEKPKISDQDKPKDNKDDANDFANANLDVGDDAEGEDGDEEEAVGDIVLPGNNGIVADNPNSADTYARQEYLRVCGACRVTPGQVPGVKELIGDTPDDDHFFPFFLTSIVLVVLLYVLYHNKGKVTKVFLGLIVEGRQNGRRRNSRGHAYRRLDTLEQAMSGNLAAQPSKIIY